VPRYPRLGMKDGFQVRDTVYLLAVNDDQSSDDRWQVIFRSGTDNGDNNWEADWGEDWQYLEEVGDVPIIGFPSAPEIGVGPGGGDTLMFSYMDIQAVYLEAAHRFLTDDGDFTDLDVDGDPNIDITGSDTYFTRSNAAIAGDFGIGPFTVLLPATSAKRAYIVYHDFAAETNEDDGDFDVFLIKGEYNHSVEMWEWDVDEPFKVNTDTGLGVKSDQFMPAAVIDGDILHIAYYDTRDDLQEPGNDVKIGLTYARVKDNFNGTYTVHELICDTEAIDTTYLLNPKSIGDRIDLTLTPDRKKAVIAYMGTEHPRVGQQTPEQDDEAIFVQVINLDEED
jgi:hypothetical protein